jgi:hypothetical protein
MRRTTLLERGAMALALHASIAGCAMALPPRDRVARAAECHFVVFNNTPVALEIRKFSGLSTIAIGAINPGELLSESTSCAEGRVHVAGVPIPMQVGAPPRGALVHGSADLVPGTRVNLGLYWP